MCIATKMLDFLSSSMWPFSYFIFYLYSFTFCPSLTACIRIFWFQTFAFEGKKTSTPLLWSVIKIQALQRWWASHIESRRGQRKIHTSSRNGKGQEWPAEIDQPTDEKKKWKCMMQLKKSTKWINAIRIILLDFFFIYIFWLDSMCSPFWTFVAFLLLILIVRSFVHFVVQLSLICSRFLHDSLLSLQISIALCLMTTCVYI